MREILYFTGTWCGPCKQLAPRMEKLKSEGKINYRKVDVDQDTNLTTKYAIRNIPTLVLLENGEVKGRLMGLNTEQAIQNFYNG